MDCLFHPLESLTFRLCTQATHFFPPRLYGFKSKVVHLFLEHQGTNKVRKPQRSTLHGGSESVTARAASQLTISESQGNADMTQSGGGERVDEKGRQELCRSWAVSVQWNSF